MQNIYIYIGGNLLLALFSGLIPFQMRPRVFLKCYLMGVFKKTAVDFREILPFVSKCSGSIHCCDLVLKFYLVSHHVFHVITFHANTDSAAHERRDCPNRYIHKSDSLSR